jgi:hypothetical protein
MALLEYGKIYDIDTPQQNRDLINNNQEHPLPPTPGRPKEWDWRNVNGIDYTTSVRDQMDQSDCASMAVISAMEIQIKIGLPWSPFFPELAKDDEPVLRSKGPILSVVDNFRWQPWTNSGASWSLQQSIERAWRYGVCLENILPSTNPRPVEVKDPPKGTPRVYIFNALKIFDEELVKKILWRNGPLVAGMDCYMSLREYKRKDDGSLPEYYQHTQASQGRKSLDDRVGDHAVCIVGYKDFDDSERKEKGIDGYWIAKNSWSSLWADHGWFNIPYGESDIGRDTSFIWLSVSSNKIPDLIPDFQDRMKPIFVSSFWNSQVEAYWDEVNWAKVEHISREHMTQRVLDR